MEEGEGGRHILREGAVAFVYPIKRRGRTKHTSLSDQQRSRPSTLPYSPGWPGPSLPRCSKANIIRHALARTQTSNYFLHVGWFFGKKGQNLLLDSGKCSVLNKEVFRSTQTCDSFPNSVVYLQLIPRARSVCFPAQKRGTTGDEEESLLLWKFHKR